MPTHWFRKQRCSHFDPVRSTIESILRPHVYGTHLLIRNDIVPQTSKHRFVPTTAFDFEGGQSQHISRTAKNEQSEECVPCRQSFFWHFTPQYATRLHRSQKSAVRHSIGLLQREQLPSFNSIMDDRRSTN